MIHEAHFGEDIAKVSDIRFMNRPSLCSSQSNQEPFEQLTIQARGSQGAEDSSATLCWYTTELLFWVSSKVFFMQLQGLSQKSLTWRLGGCIPLDSGPLEAQRLGHLLITFRKGLFPLMVLP